MKIASKLQFTWQETATSTAPRSVVAALVTDLRPNQPCRCTVTGQGLFISSAGETLHLPLALLLDAARAEIPEATTAPLAAPAPEAAQAVLGERAARLQRHQNFVARNKK